MVGDNVRLYDLRRYLVAQRGSPVLAAIIQSVNGQLNACGPLVPGSHLLLQTDGDGWFLFWNVKDQGTSPRDFGIKLLKDQHYYFTLNSIQNSVLFQGPSNATVTLRAFLIS